MRELDIYIQEINALKTRKVIISCMGLYLYDSDPLEIKEWMRRCYKNGYVIKWTYFNANPTLQRTNKIQ